jgi:hypothetical protein
MSSNSACDLSLPCGGGILLLFVFFGGIYNVHVRYVYITSLPYCCVYDRKVA